MSQLTYKEHQIDQRDDNYVNLTQMAKANKVRLNNYFLSPETKKYLKAAEESQRLDSSQCPQTAAESQRPESGQWDLVQVVSTNRSKSTWGHPLVALHFGQWVSPEFHVWCNRNIHTLMTTGSVSIDTHITPASKPSLPWASVDPIPGEIAPMTERALCNRLVREYVFNQSSAQPLNEQDTWRWMYRELKYRHKYDINARHDETKYKTKLAQIEADGYLPQLLAICNYFLSN
jgi:hypothetical protein